MTDQVLFRDDFTLRAMKWVLVHPKSKLVLIDKMYDDVMTETRRVGETAMLRVLEMDFRKVIWQMDIEEVKLYVGEIIRCSHYGLPFRDLVKEILPQLGGISSNQGWLARIYSGKIEAIVPDELMTNSMIGFVGYLSVLGGFSNMSLTCKQQIMMLRSIYSGSNHNRYHMRTYPNPIPKHYDATIIGKYGFRVAAGNDKFQKYFSSDSVGLTLKDCLQYMFYVFQRMHLQPDKTTIELKKLLEGDLNYDTYIGRVGKQFLLDNFPKVFVPSKRTGKLEIDFWTGNPGDVYAAVLSIDDYLSGGCPDPFLFGGRTPLLYRQKRVLGSNDEYTENELFDFDSIPKIILIDSAWIDFYKVETLSIFKNCDILNKNLLPHPYKFENGSEWFLKASKTIFASNTIFQQRNGAMNLQMVNDLLIFYISSYLNAVPPCAIWRNNLVD